MIFMAPERPIKDHKDTKRELVQLKKDLQNMSLQDGNNIFISVHLNLIYQNTKAKGLFKYNIMAYTSVMLGLA